MKTFLTLLLSACACLAQMGLRSPAWVAAATKPAVVAPSLPSVAAWTTNYGATAAYVSSNITVSGANKLLLVSCSWYRNPSTAMKPVYFGTAEMTLLTNNMFYSGRATNSIYYLLNPPDGTGYIYATTAVASTEFALVGVLLNNAAQAAPLVTGTNSNTVGIIGTTNAFASSTTSMLSVDFLTVFLPTTVTPGLSQTEIGHVNKAAGETAAYFSQRNGLSGSVSNAWIFDSAKICAETSVFISTP